MHERIAVKYEFAEKPKDVPQYTYQESTIEIGPDTPKISFLSLNGLLKQQFYNISSPCLRRNLFLSSKAMEQIDCPVYVTSDTCIHDEHYAFWENSGMKFVIKII